MQQKVREFLEDNLIQPTRELRLRRFIFQQNNHLKQTVKATQKWFKDNKVNVLERPSQIQSIQLRNSGWNWKGLFITNPCAT